MAVVVVIITRTTTFYRYNVNFNEPFRRYIHIINTEKKVINIELILEKKFIDKYHLYSIDANWSERKQD